MEKIVHNLNTGSAASRAVKRAVSWTDITADCRQGKTSTGDDSADDDSFDYSDYLNWSRDSEYSDDSFDYSDDDSYNEGDCNSEDEGPIDNTWMRGYLWFLET